MSNGVSKDLQSTWFIGFLKANLEFMSAKSSQINMNPVSTASGHIYGVSGGRAQLRETTYDQR